MASDSGSWDYWWPRFERLAASFVANEHKWRKEAQPHKTEIKGTLDIPAGNGVVTLSVRADRIDRMHDGTYALIDYKSGGTYSEKAIISGASPQLPLEGMILEQGGFVDLMNARAGYAGYWKLTGGRQGIDIKALKNQDVLKEAIESTSEGFHLSCTCAQSG